MPGPMEELTVLLRFDSLARFRGLLLTERKGSKVWKGRVRDCRREGKDGNGVGREESFVCLRV